MNILTTIALTGLLAATSVQALVQELSDQELEQLRGKYVAPGQVLYFGVSMESRWSQDGQEYRSGIDLSLSRQGQLSVNYRSTFSLYRTEPQVQEPLTRGGEGISQVILLAGTGNQVQNDLVLDTQASTRSIQDPATGSAFYSGSNQGFSTRLGVTQDGVFIGIFSPAQGHIIQGIGHGGVFQEVHGSGQGMALNNNVFLEVALGAEHLSSRQVFDQLGMLTGLGL